MLRVCEARARVALWFSSLADGGVAWHMELVRCSALTHRTVNLVAGEMAE